MAKSCYSVVLPHSAEHVWAHIRSFGDYAWSGVAGDTIIEDGKAGDQVGAVRHVRLPGKDIRQRLLMHSDRDRAYSYEFAGPPSVPVRNYLATIRVLPVIATGHAFVEWWATFDCAEHEEAQWVNHLAQQGFAVWLAALRDSLACNT